MKPYLTLDETKSILNLIKSNDDESIFLGLNILTSKCFKTTPSLRTAIYNAQNILRLKKSGSRIYSHKITENYTLLIKALFRYANKLGHTGN